jgi:hypothetical protein
VFHLLGSAAIAPAVLTPGAEATASGLIYRGSGADGS